MNGVDPAPDDTPRTVEDLNAALRLRYEQHRGVTRLDPGRPRGSEGWSVRVQTPNRVEVVWTERGGDWVTGTYASEADAVASLAADLLRPDRSDWGEHQTSLANQAPWLVDGRGGPSRTLHRPPEPVVGRGCWVLLIPVAALLLAIVLKTLFG